MRIHYTTQFNNTVDAHELVSRSRFEIHEVVPFYKGGILYNIIATRGWNKASRNIFAGYIPNTSGCETWTDLVTRKFEYSDGIYPVGLPPVVSLKRFKY